MRQFNFTLQSLYGIKKIEEKQHKRHMRKIESRLQELHNKLDELNRDLADTKSSYVKDLSGSIQAHKLNHYNHYFKKIAEHKTHQNEKILAQNIKKNECIKAQIETLRELKSLDKLRKKQYDEYLSEVRKEEDKIIEDIVSYKIIAS
ncbi:MAG: flagellar export protein FliJ [Clostridiales bacterium]|nr:flagellar export protein FliJ [Clostridiales bacterium]